MKHTRLMKELEHLDEADMGTRWVLKRQPHWRKATVAERTHGEKYRPVQYTVRELVEEIVASNNAQREYHGRWKACESAKPSSWADPSQIHYGQIAAEVLRRFWIRISSQVLADAWSRNAQVGIRVPSREDVELSARELQQLMVEAVEATSEKAQG
jgi:hypothetical protein